MMSWPKNKKQGCQSAESEKVTWAWCGGLDDRCIGKK